MDQLLCLPVLDDVGVFSILCISRRITSLFQCQQVVDRVGAYLKFTVLIVQPVDFCLGRYRVE